LRRPESARADSGRAKIPEGDRFAAAPLLYIVKLADRPAESARADSGRAKIPEGDRFAAAAFVFAITPSGATGEPLARIAVARSTEKELLGLPARFVK